jgi:hypothetical protein
VYSRSRRDDRALLHPNSKYIYALDPGSGSTLGTRCLQGPLGEVDSAPGAKHARLVACPNAGLPTAHVGRFTAAIAGCTVIGQLPGETKRGTPGPPTPRWQDAGAACAAASNCLGISTPSHSGRGSTATRGARSRSKTTAKRARKSRALPDRARRTCRTQGEQTLSIIHCARAAQCAQGPTVRLRMGSPV